MEAMYESKTPEQRIAELESQIVDYKNKLNIALGRATEYASSYENFKERVVKTTWDWDGGCKDGKREFLEALGLEAPLERYEATITLVFEDSDYDDSDGYESWLDDRINQDIGRHLKNFEDYSINVREIRR